MEKSPNQTESEGQVGVFLPIYHFKERVKYVLALLVFIGVVIVLVGFAGHILLLVLASILVAIMLDGARGWLRDKLHIPHHLALGLTFVLIAAALGLTGWAMAPTVAKESDEIIKAVPASWQRLTAQLDDYDWYRQMVGGLPSPNKVMSEVAPMVKQVQGVFSGVVGIIGGFLIIAFVGAYFAAQPHIYIKGIVKLFPKPKRPRAREVLKEIGDTLRLWLKGKLLSMVAVGVATTLGLTLLGVPLALTLGIIAGLLDFIPNIGPILAGIPAILIAFTESPELALYVALLYLAVQLLEGYVLLPLVERQTVSLPPAVTISMQVLLGIPFGLPGVALATPLTAILFVLVAMLYVEDVLGDKIQLPSENGSDD